MDSDRLLFSTGTQQIDSIVRGTVGVLETAFPGRVRGCYLFGSYADDSAVAASDIDLFVVFKGEFLDGEERRVQQLSKYCGLISPVSLDLLPVSESVMLREGHFRLKSASRIIHGEDIRDRMPQQPHEAYLQKYTYAPCGMSAYVFRHQKQIAFPLAYPDPDGVFYGYDAQTLHSAPGVPDLNGLVGGVCWIATAIVGIKAGQLVESKRASVALYRRHINDEWAPFVEDVYQKGNREWGYSVPTEQRDRAVLRDLCARMLAFENHYLTIHLDYTLGELRRPGIGNALFAARRLGEVIYPDERVIAALEAVDTSGEEELGRVVVATLERTQQARDGRLALERWMLPDAE